MSDIKHTPGPFGFFKSKHGTDRGESVIAVVGGIDSDARFEIYSLSSEAVSEWYFDAEFIVAALNSYDKIESTLSNAKQALENAEAVVVKGSVAHKAIVKVLEEIKGVL